MIAHNFAHNLRRQKGEVVTKYPKTDARYWRSRVLRNVRTINGERLEDEHYSIQLMHAGRREWFNTGENEKAAAGAIVAEIYRELERGGWDAALERFKPAKLRKAAPVLEPSIIQNPTVGEYLAFVEAEGGVKPTTLSAYSRMFRLIVSHVLKVKKSSSRFYAAGTALKALRSKLDAVPLADVTAEAVRLWKLSYLKQAGAEPTSRARAEVTMNSIMRQAKALFSKRLIALTKGRMILPDPLPLHDVEFCKVPSSYYKYKSKVDAAALLTAGREELAEGGRLAEFQILVLALMCGLRRNELDKLLWTQIDFKTGKISIETTHVFKAKSDASNAEVDIEPELVALLRGWKLLAKSEFVIESDVKPRLEGNSAHYRLSHQLDSLIVWLRGKGVDAPKPLHTLRKEYGSLMVKTYGIYVASCALRHEDLQVTVKHYADTKARATPGLGAMLVPPNVQTVAFAAPQLAANMPPASKPKRGARRA